MSNYFKKPSAILLAILMLALSPLSASNLLAVEITPIEKVDPEKLQNDLDELGSGNELTQNKNSVQKQTTKKSKPSVWSWLTNQSRKPASYHFIDILEILD